VQHIAEPFELAPQLQQDCFVVGYLPLCQVLLLNDANFTWVVLVPRIAGATEIFQLSDSHQSMLLQESSVIARMIAEHFPCDKLNIAALGNIVSQLHIHHIARRRDDLCWPGVVWGYGQGRAYQTHEKNTLLQTLQNLLSHSPGFCSAPVDSCADE